jgi:hypothetical protein
MAHAWGQTAQRLANADAFVASECETGRNADFDLTYSETFATELARCRAATRGLPPTLVAQLSALFDAAKLDDD